ncbi:hypothetical protein [Leptolyngbya sp. FACHB-261]|uniref:hypothetical protein n=1 Tax=Leptolyngbya sp. FACHB-261 TaxID=2692806 RepID=UPI00168248A4|nr:hypothetical protein [Leptolyngbya sp. FACHB-261]MBD2101872.1 hypothetical protein [Leptolyngbya sp. FACHB-261]
MTYGKLVHRPGLGLVVHIPGGAEITIPDVEAQLLGLLEELPSPQSSIQSASAKPSLLPVNAVQAQPS